MPKHARNDRDATFWENAEQDLELATQERYAQGDYPQDYSYPDYRDAFDGAYFDSEYQEPDQYLDLFPQDEDFPYQEGRRSRRTDKPELHPMQRRSRKIRRTLIVVIVLLIALIGATIYFNYQLLEEARRQAIEQVTHNDPTDTDKLKDDDPHDATTATTKKTDVVYLVALIGMGQDDAIRAIGHGATIVSSLPIKEEGNPIRTELKVSLTEEPGDTRSGTPTVYLALDGAGVIIRAGYSAAITTLGYGSSSFYDAVTRDYIIENTLIEAGIGIDLGTAVLPADKMEYTTYKSDGRTVEKETYSFSGTIELNNVAFEWSAVLRYDYTAVIATGNLADTIRQIYVYVYVPSAATPPELLPPDPIEEEEEEGEEGEEGEGEEGEGEGEGASTEGA